MNPAAARLSTRVFLAQLLVGSAILAILLGFVPQLLLLGDDVARAAIAFAVKAAPPSALLVLLLTQRRLSRHKPLLRALALGSTTVEPEEVASLAGVPSYVSALFIVLTSTTIVVSMLTPIRPALLDWDTAVSLTLVGTVIVATGALPLYVLVRAAVARALELVQPDIMGGVLERADGSGQARRRILRRVLAAIVTPVGFIAVGAALIANAHVRIFDEQSRERTAEAIARVALESPPGTAAVGRAEAIAAAAEFGFAARVDHDVGRFAIERGDQGQVALTTALDEGGATIRFHVTAVSPLSRADVTIALLAVALAIVVGLRFARSFADDLAYATYAVRILGTEDFLHGAEGAASLSAARYAQVAALNRAISTLAGRFRVFASAQEMALEARDAARRTRSLLFASVSHDLRSPLNAILGFTQLVGEKPLNFAQRESLGLIRQRGRELLSLIETILDVAKIEAGRVALVKTNMHPAALLAQAVRRTHALTEEQTIDIALAFDDDLPRLRVDGVRLGQAITALIGAVTRILERPGAPEGLPREVSVRAMRPTGSDNNGDDAAPDSRDAFRGITEGDDRPPKLPMVKVGPRPRVSDPPDSGRFGSAEGIRIEVEGPPGSLAPGELLRLLAPEPRATGHRPHGGLTLAVTLARSLVELHGGTLEIAESTRGSPLFSVTLPGTWS